MSKYWPLSSLCSLTTSSNRARLDFSVTFILVSSCLIFSSASSPSTVLPPRGTSWFCPFTSGEFLAEIWGRAPNFDGNWLGLKTCNLCNGHQYNTNYKPKYRYVRASNNLFSAPKRIFEYLNNRLYYFVKCTPSYTHCKHKPSNILIYDFMCGKSQPHFNLETS